MIWENSWTFFSCIMTSSYTNFNWLILLNSWVHICLPIACLLPSSDPSTLPNLPMYHLSLHIGASWGFLELPRVCWHCSDCDYGFPAWKTWSHHRPHYPILQCCSHLHQMKSWWWPFSHGVFLKSTSEPIVSLHLSLSGWQKRTGKGQSSGSGALHFPPLTAGRRWRMNSTDCLSFIVYI